MPKQASARPEHLPRFEPTFGGLLLVLSLCDVALAAPHQSSPPAPAKHVDSSAFLERTMPIGNLGSITCNAGRYAFNPAWTLLAAPQDRGSVRLFDVATGKPLPPLEGGFKVGAMTYMYADRVPSAYCGFSSDGRTLVWSWGKKVVVWDVASRQILERREVPGSKWGFDFSLLGGGEGFEQKVVAAWPAPPNPGSGSRVESPDGRLVVFRDGKKGFGLIDVASGRSVGPLIEVKYLGAMQFSPDGTHLATVGWVPRRGSKRDYEVQIWNVEALRSGGGPTR